MVIRKGGRKRKAGKRERNGRLERKVDVVSVAAAMPHRAILPALDNEKRPIPKHDQRAENPFGCLNLVGLVPDDLYEAGLQMKRLVARFRSAIAAPNPNAAGIDLTGRRSGNVIQLETAPGDGLWNSYDAAFGAIKSRYGKTVFNTVVIHERALQPGDLPWLTDALKDLKTHFGGYLKSRAMTA